MLIKKYSNGCRAVLATKEHAKELAPFLRLKDRLEVNAEQFSTCEEALMAGLNNDDLTITALDKEGKPFAMFGVGTALDKPYIWLLGSAGVKDNWYVFAKASKYLLPFLITDYPVVSGLVIKEYKISIKWLKWLGAIFIREVEHNGTPFYEFIIKNEQY